ncbi:MAG TPA: hypothetical protein VJC39_02475 [Candidatus Nanoarchaeia archaeon]|nr:hypothetical protein [Candidatus Nanoarchaeia archaeon]
MKLSPFGKSIDDYLENVPLTVQSIAYDLKECRLIGSIGINSIEKRLVKVNNYGEAYHSARINSGTVKEYLLSKAQSIGFSVPEKGGLRVVEDNEPRVGSGLLSLT